MSTSFKSEYRGRSSDYRTPSPPRDAYEPLVDANQEPTQQQHDGFWSRRNIQKSKHTTDESAKTFSLGRRIPNGQDEIVKPLHSLSEPTNFLSKNETSEHPPTTSQSALEHLAALATSPDLGTSSCAQTFIQPLLPISPLINFSPHMGYDGTGDYHLQERPAKRSRSEVIESQPYPLVVSRPATSHAGQVMSTPDTSMEDAELLLSFAIGAHQPRPSERSLPITIAPSISSDIGTIPSQIYDTPKISIPIANSVINTTEHSLPQHDVPPLPPTEAQISTTSSSDHQTVIWDGEVVTTDGNGTRPHGLPTEISLETPTDIPTDGSGSTEEPKPRIYKGWPKGKPRGPRQVPYAKRGTRRAAKQSSAFVNASPSANSTSAEGGTQGGLNSDFRSSRGGTSGSVGPSFRGEIYTGNAEPERQRSHSTSALRILKNGLLDSHTARRGKSMPAAIHTSMHVHTTPPKSTTVQTKITSCGSCHSIKNPSNGLHDTWIACTGCQTWFHQFCVGFKTERQARDVDKFYCNGCVPVHGPTTFVRKSSRAHASVDYAGLNEGKIRTSTDVPDHHYINQFIDGTIQFLPETFPRMRPELVTAEYFEKSGNFSEPVVIPAWMNPRPAVPGTDNTSLDIGNGQTSTGPGHREAGEWFSEDFEYDCVADEGQDKLDMIIPQGLTVRRVAELYGPEEKVEVIDVKSQEGEDKRWSMRQWADYYEAKGEKPVRNVISLEVSQSKLGRLIRRPKIVRDLDLQDSVWPQEDTAKGVYPKVQFYCLMSVANCYTDFHIDFGGSSVYYHILSGKKTFFFIPPKKQHLKKYEDWCLSSSQSSIFLGDETKECYRVDLSSGDTMLIPSGWIHAVWTPVDTLVIGGNFLTRLHYGMQIQINEIEKNTGVARKFRYPYFQKVLWCAVIRYLECDPLPLSVAQLLLNGDKFERDVLIYNEIDNEDHALETNPETYNARYYSQGEVEGWQDLIRYVIRTVMVTLGKVQGVTKTTQEAVLRSMPKGYADYLEIAQTFAMWVAWKRGNEEIPPWAYPDAVITEEESTGTKKMSAAALKRMERQAAHDAFVLASGRRSSARQVPKEQGGNSSPHQSTEVGESGDAGSSAKGRVIGKTKQPNRGRLIACDSCRQRRRRCKHNETDTISPDIAQRFGIKQWSQVPTMLDNSTLDTILPTSNITKEKSPSSAPLPSSRTPSMFSVVINTPEVEARPALANEHAIPVSQTILRTNESLGSNPIVHDDALTEHELTSTLILDVERLHEEVLSTVHEQDTSASAKRAKTKACEECRKSKRRCIHDGSGHVDPVKAQESPVSRSTHGPKRSRTDGDAVHNVLKRARKDSESMSGSLQEPKIESSTEYDPATHLPSPSIESEHMLGISDDQSVVLYDPTHPPTAVDVSTLGSEDESFPSPSPQEQYEDHLHDAEAAEHIQHVRTKMSENQPHTAHTPLALSGVRSEPTQDIADSVFEAHEIKTTPEKYRPTIVYAADSQPLLLDPLPAFEPARKDSERQSGTPSLHVQTASNDSVDASVSVPSTPPMSPLTDLGPDSPPHSPGLSIKGEFGVTIKTESPPVPRQTPRQRKQVDRLSTGSFGVKFPPTISQCPSSVTTGAAVSPPNTFAKPSSGRKSTSSRSASSEVRAASHDTVGFAIANGTRVLSEAEEIEARDIKLARELSEQDFGLRRRSR